MVKYKTNPKHIMQIATDKYVMCRIDYIYLNFEIRIINILSTGLSELLELNYRAEDYLIIF